MRHYKMKWHELTEKTGYVSIGNAFVPGYFLTENELVLIDSGPIHSKRLMELLDERHWRVRAVIHTHVHIDHVANDLLLLEKFPDILFYTSKDEADAIASPEDMMRSMGFDTAAHAKEAQAVYYPEKLHIIGVDMKRPEIMIDGEIFELISLEGHSVGHVGVVTPDGICCLGDAIVSEDVLNVSKLPYMANVQKSLASMEKVRSLNYEIYVIAHGQNCHRQYCQRTPVVQNSAGSSDETDDQRESAGEIYENTTY